MVLSSDALVYKMAFTQTQLIIFIIAAAGISSLLQLRAQIEYGADKATIKIGNDSGSNFATNSFLHPPRRLTLYYLDASKPSHIPSGNIDNVLKKAVFERPASEVQNEIKRDDEFEMNFLQVHRAWKMKEENGEDAGKEPKKEERQKDQPIRGNLDLTFVNLESNNSYLRIEILEIGYEDVYAVAYSPTFCDGITLTKSNNNKEGYLTIGFERVWLSETIFSDYWDTQNNRIIMKEPDVKKDMLTTNWVRPSERTAFAFAVKDEIIREMKPKIFVENHALNIYVYKNRPFLRLRHTVTREKINIKLERMDVMMAHFDVSLKPWIKNIRVLLRNPNEKPTVVYTKAANTNGDFDGNVHMDDDVANRYLRMSNARYYLRKTADSIDIEVDMVSNLADEELMLKVVQSKGQSRISFFQKDRYQSRTKTIRTVKHRNNLPLELIFVSSKAKSSQKFEYDRKMLIDYSLFRTYHFNQYIQSESFISEREISTKKGNTNKDIVDFVWVKNYNSNSEELKNLHLTEHEEADILSVYMHNRDAGLITAFKANEMVLYHLTQSADEYNVDLTLPVTPSFGAKFQYMGYILDVNNNFQEFEKPAFAVVPNKIYFLAFDTYMQKQLDNMKIEVCENKPGMLNLCIFSYVNYVEIDQYKEKLVFHQQYYPTTVGLGGVKYNYNFEVVYLERNKCSSYKKTEFTRFTSYDYKKYWVQMEFRFVNDKFTTVTCDDNQRVCYLVFVKTGVTKPTPANLKTLKVNMSSGTCTIESRKDLLLTLQNSKMSINIDGDNGGVGYQLLDESGLDYSKVQYAAWNNDETGSFQCQKNKRDPSKCDMNYIFLKDLSNSVNEELLDATKTPFTAPLVLIKADYPMINFDSFFKKGDISVVFTQGYVDLSNDSNALGFLGFNKRKIFQKSSGHFRGTLKLFLLSTVPVVVPIEFNKMMNFEQAYKNSESFEFQATTSGNVDEVFTYVMYNELAKGTFSLYIIENEKNELEVLVYNEKLVEVMETIEGKMRGPLPDFRDLLVGDKNQKTQNLIMKIEWKEYTSPTMFMTSNDKQVFIHVIKTAYPNVVVFVTDRTLIENVDPKSYSMGFFSEPYAKRAVAGLMDLASKYQEENGEAYRRLI